MKTLVFVRDKEWIDQAKSYIYDALRYIDIKYQWNSKEHIRIDDNHVIKFIIDPTELKNKHVKYLYPRMLHKKHCDDNPGILGGNYDLEIEHLAAILGDFLELKPHGNYPFANIPMNKLMVRDSYLRSIKRDKAEIKKAKEVLKEKTKNTNEMIRRLKDMGG